MRARTLLRQFACLVCLICLGLIHGRAEAFGTARAEKTSIDEVDGTWKVVLNIDYGSVPDLNYIPVLLVFTPTMLYERSLTDESKEKPVITKRSLGKQPAINEQIEIGFSDGQGKTFRRTKFDFKIRRDRGFEAGEYDLEIKRTSDNKTLGTKFRLILNGDNPVVDRRSMVFAGEKKKDAEPGTNETSKPREEPKDESHVKADGELEPNPEDAPVKPPSEKPMQGGCGCRTADGGNSAFAGAVFSALLGAVLVRRRRSRLQSNCAYMP